MAACGTRTSYVLGCRCEGCKAANSAYMKRWKASRPPLEPNDRRHGTINGYVNYRCRCPPCTLANRSKGQVRRAKVAA